MAEAELSLIEKVELRIALANTDEKFESSLKLYLAPLLLKFASPHAQVRTQIGKTVKYLLTRINSAKNVKLPLDALLKQVKNPGIATGSDPTVVQSYTLLFLSRGLTRLTESEKHELVPQVVAGISKMKSTISARLFNILLKLIVNFKFDVKNKDDETKLRQFLNLDEIIDDERFLIEKFYKFMLMQPIQLDSSNFIPKGITFPGLSKDDTAFFTYDAGVTLDSPTLTTYKNAILKITEYGFDPSSSIILLIASADSSSAISELSTTLLKRKSIDYEDPYIVDTLISLFIGDTAISRPAAKLQLQEKIMNFCCQSKRAALSSTVSTLSMTGLESDFPKLKQATIRFIRWTTTIMASVSADDQTDDFNIKIADQLIQNLQLERQSETGGSFSSFMLQRRYQYEALALILRRAPKLENLTFVKFLFEMLQNDSPDLRTSIQEALSSLIAHLTTLPDMHKLELKDYLQTLIESTSNLINSDKKDNSDACRYMAIKFSNSCLPFDDPEARILDILVQTPHDKPDTIEEAARGLHPYWFGLLQSSNTKEYKSTSELLGFKNANTLNFPSFKAMVKSLNGLKDVNFNKCIKFVLQCLVMQAIKGEKTVVVIDQEWETRLEKALEFDEKVNSLIGEELKRLALAPAVDTEGDLMLVEGVDSSDWNTLDVFINSLLDHLSYSSDLDTARTLTKVLSMCQPSTISKLVPRIDDLKTSLSKILSEDGKLYISKILGIVVSHPDYNDQLAAKTLASLLEINEVTAVGYVASRLVLSNRESILSPELFNAILEKTNKSLDSSNSKLLRSSLECISQLSMFGCLGPVLQLSDKLEEYKSQFTDRLIPLVKKSDERATMALSFLSLSQKHELITQDSMTDAEGELNLFEKALYDTHLSKETEYLFTTGEAYTILAAGWNAKIMDKKIDIQNSDFKPKLPSSTERLLPLLSMILKACKHTKPALRRAGCIWLLSMTQYCGHLPEMKERLGDIHVSFMRFLSDRDELIQESASRGLSIVYEMGDVDFKDTLVHNLLLSFTDSNKTKNLISGSIDNETELFEPGVLNTGDGSVSTYKDILSLASEVGDPSLVYKFMSLAKNSALWSSRKGIAFGLGAILDKSKLDELISKDSKLSSRLIPKLFRYRFDPSTSVAKTMNEIWSTLILDSSKTITANFDIILKELLTNMGNREWRVRQASTAGLQDLLRYVALEDYESHLEKIWTMSFRAMDDIKDSVRKEGNSLTRYLATTMVTKITNANSENAGKSNEVLKQLIPFLLGSNGLLNESEDVKSFAFDTILKLSKTSSLALKPFVSEMVEQMVVLMSSVEPQMINYLTLNADKYNMKSEDIDAQRLNIVGNSPIMEAIERLMNLLDDNLMPQFVISLSNAIKKSVGLPSKVTGSKIIINLIVKHLFISQKYGDDLLKMSVSQLKDRNETIARSYAVAIGYCVRISSYKKIESLSKRLTKYYFESKDDESMKKISAVTSEAISRYSNDRFQSIATSFLPLAFVGKHDLNKDIGKVFQKEWLDSTSGGANSIKLYLKEIIELTKLHIQSTDFQIRQAIALSIIEVVDKSGDHFSHLSQYLSDLFSILLESLKGRSYKGKEDLLNSLVLLSINTEGYLLETGNSSVFEACKKTVLLEARRKNKEYAKHSIKSLGRFIGMYPDEDMCSEYIDLVSTMILPKPKSSSDMDTEGSGDSDNGITGNGKEIVNKKLKDAKIEEFKLSLVENLVIAVNVKEPSGQLVEFILRSLKIFFDSDSGISYTYKSQLSSIDCLILLINKLTKLNDHALNSDTVGRIYETWCVIEQNCATKESLQNVLVSFIRLTKAIATKVVHNDTVKKETCVAKLLQLQDEKINSVINTEIQKALEDI